MEVKEKIISNILSQTTDHNNQKIGIELETILYTKNNLRIPVNEEEGISSINLLKLLESKQIENGNYSLEPGGQLEWASPPCTDLNDLNRSIKLFYDELDPILLSNGLIAIDYGLDPKYSPEDIELINQKKYIIMDNYLNQSGSLGRWMMRNTASIQINLDTTGKSNMEKIAFIADCLHPVSAYLFANSPFKRGKATGTRNFRQVIWHNTDRYRCGNLFEHGIYEPNGLIEKYIDFMMGVPGIFEFDRSGNFQKAKSKLGDRISNLIKLKETREIDIRGAIHQIFTNVRLKEFVEIRGADRTPKGFEIVPAAFWVGLLLNDETRDEVYNQVKLWSEKDRKLFNQCAFSLELDQRGPLDKPFFYWINLFSEYSIMGLERRGLNEETLFQDFYGSVLEKGPFSLQEQLSESIYRS